jgi:hypothetical protein
LSFSQSATTLLPGQDKPAPSVPMCGASRFVVSCGIRLSEVGASEIRKPQVVNQAAKAYLEFQSGAGALAAEGKENPAQLWLSICSSVEKCDDCMKGRAVSVSNDILTAGRISRWSERAGSFCHVICNWLAFSVRSIAQIATAIRKRTATAKPFLSTTRVVRCDSQLRFTVCLCSFMLLFV